MMRMQLRKMCAIAAAVSICAGGVAISATQAHAVTGAAAIGIGDDLRTTLAYEKVLDLSDSHVSVHLDQSDRDAIGERVHQEFLADMHAVIADVDRASDELQARGILVRTEDGSENPDWDEAWKDAYSENVVALTREVEQCEADKTVPYAQREQCVRDAYARAGSVDVSSDPVRIYTRTVFARLGTHFQYGDGNVIKAKDIHGVPLVGDEENQAGNLAWHRDYDAMLQGDFTGDIYMQHIWQSYSALQTNHYLNDLLRERIGDQLAGVAFDFFISMKYLSSVIATSVSKETSKQVTLLKVAPCKLLTWILARQINPQMSNSTLSLKGR